MGDDVPPRPRPDLCPACWFGDCADCYGALMCDHAVYPDRHYPPDADPMADGWITLGPATPVDRAPELPAAGFTFGPGVMYYREGP